WRESSHRLWQLNCLFGLHQPTTKVSEQTNSLSCNLLTRRNGKPLRRAFLTDCQTSLISV
ncbi:MAG: hypothetical protein ACK578_26845, partial [Pirellula sp.]